MNRSGSRPEALSPSSSGSYRNRGESLVEVAVAAIVIAILILGLVGVLVHTSAANTTTRETAVATEGARGMVEVLEGGTFSGLVSAYGQAGDPGPQFRVDGLSPEAEDSDGQAGEIRFFVDETEDTPESNEVGIPGRDLDGDGKTTSTDTSRDVNPADGEPDYRILPVRIDIRWRGRAGKRSLAVATVLGED